jgi:hypothetical protein
MTLFCIHFVLVICLSHTNTVFSLFLSPNLSPCLICSIYTLLFCLKPCLVIIFCWCSPELSPYRPLDASHTPQTMVIHEGKL